jgi:hypothetical protein
MKEMLRALWRMETDCCLTAYCVMFHAVVMVPFVKPPTSGENGTSFVVQRTEYSGCTSTSPCSPAAGKLQE